MPERDAVPRMLVIQDPSVNEDCVIRVARTSNGDAEEKGLQVEPPDESSSTLVGDVRPALSGTPERDTGGVVRVVASGVAENLRWGWRGKDADETTDLQFRQKVGVCGRAPDVVERDTTSGDSFWSPTVLSLRSGDALGVWMKVDLAWHARSMAAGWATEFNVATLDKDDNSWAAAATATGLGDWHFTSSPIDTGPYWYSFDAVQLPDTEEILALVVGGYLDSKSDEYPIAALYYSTDDGLTWDMRTPIFFTGSAPLAVSGATGGPIVVCGIEQTESGRIVALCGQQERLFRMVSDDRGRTWVGELVEDISANYATRDASPLAGSPYQSLSVRRARNGLIFGFWHLNAGQAGDAEVAWARVYTTLGGLDWTIYPSDVPVAYSMTDVAVVVRPNGFPWVLGTYHNIYSTSGLSTVYAQEFDEIAWYNLQDINASGAPTRDPSEAAFYVSGWKTMHPLVDAGNDAANRPNAPDGIMWKPTDDPLKIDGFCGIDAVEHRGQVLVLVLSESENYHTSAVVALRCDHWQPIQERLEPVESDAFTAPTAIDRYLGGCYHKTWDAYDTPVNWGYTEVAVAGSSSWLSVDGGSWEIITTGIGNRYYRDASIPYTDQNHDAMLRTVLKVVSGGSLISDHCVVRLILQNSTTSERVGAVVRFQAVGSDLDVQLFDAFSGAAAGPKVTLADGAAEWVEVFVSVVSDGGLGGSAVVNCYGFVRVWDSAGDPDWNEGYESLDSGRLSVNVGGAEGVDFGHVSAASSAKSQWKTVQIWRHPDANHAYRQFPLLQRGDDYVEDASDTFVLGAGVRGVKEDEGIWTHMRAMPGAAFPAQFIADDVRASWRGEALAAGGVDYLSRRIYSARHLLDGSSPQRRWESNSLNEVEIVLDAEKDGDYSLAKFDVTAIAVFGRNWPSCRIQFNATDSWGAPSVDIGIGVPYSTGIYDRGSQLWSFEPGAGYTQVFDRYRATYTTPAATARGGAVFRPHRFASKETGPNFYLMFPEGLLAYKILDNDDRTLLLDGRPTPPTSAKAVIYSDRFAWDFSAHLGATTYRYMRIVLRQTTFGGGDDAFKAGTIVLGKATQLGPGLTYGYGISRTPGARLSHTQTGATSSHRQSTAARTWSMDAPALLPANEQTEEGGDIQQATESWQRVVDALARVEVNGEMLALCFDGIRMDSDAAADGEPALVDPLDLALVRLSDAGNEEHLGYWCVSIPKLGGGSETVPRDVKAIKRIAFTETF